MSFAENWMVFVKEEMERCLDFWSLGFVGFVILFIWCFGGLTTACGLFSASWRGVLAFVVFKHFILQSTLCLSKSTGKNIV